ncbi:MAG: DUF1080 domain-containing protein [Verrucomicrobiota bacterium]|jgi:hypothetical protein
MKSKTFVQNQTNLQARALALLALLAMISYSSPAQNPPAAGAAGATEHIEGFKEHLLPGSKWYQHDPDRPQPPIVSPGANFSGGAQPPSDAEVLFDGKDLSKWENTRGGAANWKVQDGYMEVTPPSDIRTLGKWSDFQLHLEWAEPTETAGLHGQARGNSGILINNMYEVQIVDSYNDKTYPDGQAGAIYGQMPPLVNASKPPGEWQTYDIIWESPRWNSTNELVQKACITVLQNGVVVQHKTEFIGSTDGIGGGVPWRGVSRYREHSPEVFVQLQNHNANPVRFRNIWIRDLHLSSRQ